MNIFSPNSRHNNDLDSFLKHLRLRGIAVGSLEIRHLQAVFKQSPQLPRNEIAELLSTVLAKNNQQHQQILRLFDQFFPLDDEPKQTLSKQQNRINLKHSRIAEQLAEAEEDDEVEEAKTETEKTQKPINFIWLGIGIIAITSILLISLANFEDKKSSTIGDTFGTDISPTADLTTKQVNKDKPISDRHLKLIPTLIYGHHN